MVHVVAGFQFAILCVFDEKSFGRLSPTYGALRERGRERRKERHGWREEREKESERERGRE